MISIKHQVSNTGRSRGRSLVPVVLLGVCMTAVTYHNVTYSANSISPNSTAETPPTENEKSYSVNNTPATEANRVGGATPTESDEPRLTVKLEPIDGSPDGESEELDEQRNSPGKVEGNAVGAGLQFEGGVQESWDDDDDHESNRNKAGLGSTLLKGYGNSGNDDKGIGREGVQDEHSQGKGRSETPADGKAGGRPENMRSTLASAQEQETWGGDQVEEEGGLTVGGAKESYLVVSTVHSEEPTEREKLEGRTASLSDWPRGYGTAEQETVSGSMSGSRLRSGAGRENGTGALGGGGSGEEADEQRLPDTSLGFSTPEHKAREIIFSVAFGRVRVLAAQHRAMSKVESEGGQWGDGGWDWQPGGGQQGRQEGEQGESERGEEVGGGDDQEQAPGNAGAVGVEQRSSSGAVVTGVGEGGKGWGGEAGWTWGQAKGGNGEDDGHDASKERVVSVSFESGPAGGHAAASVDPAGETELKQTQATSQRNQEERGALTPVASKGNASLESGGDGPAVGGEVRPLNGKEKGTIPQEGEGSNGGGASGGGLPPNGAVQGMMECAMTKEGAGASGIVNIATWKEVPGDAEYRGPFLQENSRLKETRYVTLEKDLGGFNNIRMSLESAVAFAAATGRTFVIPPPFQIWNMNVHLTTQEVDARSLFSLDELTASGRVKVMTTEEFFEKEVLTGKLGVTPSEAAKRLDVRAVSEYLAQVANQYENGLPDQPPDQAGLVLPRRMGERVDLEIPEYAFAKEWLYDRDLTEYRDGWQTAKVIHWQNKNARLLSPFYAFVLHADETAERYYARLMRDLMHYPEEVYCKASQVISLIRAEDPSGSFSTFHIRRNDFKEYYSFVATGPGEIRTNTEDHLIDGEILYIATDETDRRFFQVFEERFRVRFLQDYYEEAGVSEMNPNYIGMMEQIIASHGRTFTGCWFSTFTAYILRLRGYNGHPKTSSFYYWLPKREDPHSAWLPSNPLWATEWPFGWEGIDDTGVPDAMAP